jgi:hypothetical protein
MSNFDLYRINIGGERDPEPSSRDYPTFKYPTMGEDEYADQRVRDLIDQEQFKLDLTGTNHNTLVNLAVGNVHTQYILKSLYSSTGDILYASAASTPTRLGIGSEGYALKSISGIPSWQPATADLYDYIIDTVANGGTHVSISSMMSTFLTDAAVSGGIRRSCWVNIDDSGTNIEWGSSDIDVGSSTLTISGAGSGPARTTITFTSVSTDDAFFKTAQIYRPDIVFDNLRIAGGNSSRDGAFMMTSNASSSPTTIAFHNCEIATLVTNDRNPIVYVEAAGGNGDFVRFEQCIGAANALARSTTGAKIAELHVNNCILDLTRLVTSNGVNVFSVSGGRLTLATAGFNPSSGAANTDIFIKDTSIYYNGSGICFSRASAQINNGTIYLASIYYEQNNVAATFGNFAGRAANTEEYLFADGLMLVEVGGGAGTALTIAASIDIGYVGSVFGYGFTTTVSNSSAIPDGSLYALLLGRAGGQTLIGGTADSEKLILTSTSHATTANVAITDALRVGSSTAPTNIAVGDVTVVRLKVVDGAFGTGVDFSVTGDGALSGFLRVGSETAPTNTTAGDLTGTRLIVPNATIIHSAIIQLGGPVVIPTGGVIRFSDADDSHYIGIRAPATAQTENWVIHLPDDDPTAGQVLSAKAVASPNVTTEWVTLTSTAHDHTTADGSGVLSGDEHDSFGEYAEIATPSTPAAAKVRIYAKADGRMYRKDDAGTEAELGGSSGLSQGSVVATVKGLSGSITG